MISSRICLASFVLSLSTIHKKKQDNLLLRDPRTATGPNRSEIFKILLVFVRSDIKKFFLILVRSDHRFWNCSRSWSGPGFVKLSRFWSKLVQDFFNFPGPGPSWSVDPCFRFWNESKEPFGNDHALNIRYEFLHLLIFKWLFWFLSFWSSAILSILHLKIKHFAKICKSWELFFLSFLNEKLFRTK